MTLCNPTIICFSAHLIQKHSLVFPSFFRSLFLVFVILGASTEKPNVGRPCAMLTKVVNTVSLVLRSQIAQAVFRISGSQKERHLSPQVHQPFTLLQVHPRCLFRNLLGATSSSLRHAWFCFYIVYTVTVMADEERVSRLARAVLHVSILPTIVLALHLLSAGVRRF